MKVIEWKTIVSRITRANTGDSSAEEISNADKAYQSLGINVRKGDGDFQDLGVTLGSLSKIWGSLSEQQRSYVAEQSAGVRQKAVFLNMMDDYQSSTKLATEALSAQGIAEQKNAIYLQSSEAKIKQFQNTVAILFQNMINSDGLKGFIGLMTGLVSSLSGVTEKLGTVGTVVTILGEVIGVKFVLSTGKAIIAAKTLAASNVALAASTVANATASGVATTATTARAVATGTATATTLVNATATGAGTIATTEFATAEGVATIGSVGLLGSMKASILGFFSMGTAADVATAGVLGTQAAMVVATAGLILIPIAIGAVINAFSNASKKQDEFIKTTQDSITKLKTQQTDMGTLTTTYETLASNTNKSTEEQKQFLDVQNSIISIAPSLIDHYDLEGNAYIKNAAAVKAYIYQLKSEEAEKQKILADTYGKDISSDTAKQQEAIKTLQDLQAQEKKMKSSGVGNAGSDSAFTEQMKAAEASLKTLSASIQKNKDNIKAGVTDYATLSKETKIIADDMANAMNKKIPFTNATQYADAIQGITDKLKDSNIENRISDYAKLDDEFKSGKIPLEELKIAYNKLKDSFKLLGLSAGDIKKLLPDFNSTLIPDANAAATAIAKLTTAFDNSTDSLSSYNKLMQDYKTNGRFSADSVKEIIDKHQELAGYLNNEPLLYKKMAEALDTEKNTANKAYASMMTDSEGYYDSNIKGTDTIKKALGSYYNDLTTGQKNDLANAKSIAKAKEAVEKNLLIDLSTLWDTYNTAVNDVLDRHKNLAKDVNTGDDNSDAAQAQLAKIINNNAKANAAADKAKTVQAKINSINTSFDNITAKIVAPNISDYGTDTSTGTKTNEEKAAEAADKAQAAKDKKDKAAQDKATKAEAAKEKKAAAATAKAEKAKATAEAKAAKATQHQADLEAKAAEKVAYDQLHVAQATTDASKKSAQTTLAIDIVAEAALKKKGETAAQISDAKISAIQAETQTATELAQKATAKIVDTQKKASDILIAGYQKQIDAINAKATAEDKTTQQLKYQNDIINGQNDLVNAQNQKNVRVYQNGKWQWEADQSAIKTASASLQSTQTEFAKFKTDNANTAKIDSLNALIKIQQDKQASLTSSTTTGYDSGTSNAEEGVKKINETKAEIVVGNKAKFEGGEQVINGANTSKILSGGSATSSPIATSVSASPTNSVTKTAVNKLITDTDLALKKFVTSTPAYSKSIDSKLGLSLKQNDTLLKTPLNTLLSDVDASVDKFVTASPQYSKSLDDNMGKSVKTNDILLKQPVANLITDVHTDIQKFVDSSPLYGKGTDKNIGDAITTNSELTTVPMDTIISKVTTGIDTFVKSCYAKGENIVTELGKGITDKTKDIESIVATLTKAITDDFNKGMATGSSSSSNSPSSSSKVSGTVETWLKQAMKITNTPTEYMSALEQIIMHESSGNPAAINLTDSNAKAGHPSKGIAQMIDSTFQAHKLAGHGDIWNPVDNLISSIRYQISQYGSIANTPGVKSLANGGGYKPYATGSESIPETGMAMVGEHGMEMRVLNKGDGVLTNNKTRNLMEWGKMNPNTFMNSMMPNFSTPDLKGGITNNNNSKGDTHISIANIELPNVNDSESFINGMTQLVNVRG